MRAGEGSAPYGWSSILEICGSGYRSSDCFWLLPRMLYLEAFKNLRSVVLQRNFFSKPREEYAPARSVMYYFESRRGKRNILGLPRPLYAISSLENLDYIFCIDVTCSAPNSCGANQIPAIFC